MTELAWLWAVGLSALAAWLGWRAGFKAATACAALLLHRCGVRSVDRDTRTLTFADGATHTHKEPTDGQ